MRAPAGAFPRPARRTRFAASTELHVHRKDQQEISGNEAGYEHAGRIAVQNFVKHHHEDLVAYIRASRSANRARIRSLQHAAQRFDVFDD